MTDFYRRLCLKRNDSPELQACVTSVVDQLDEASNSERPGLLLGKIQSGKTMGFLGVIAKAFDRDYDIAIVLTKGTKTLAQQTVKRISRDFAEFIDADEVLVFDIKSAPDQLTRSELRRKLVIVSKKEVRNLARIHKFFDEKYPDSKERRVLIVDDEADMASIRFTRRGEEEDYDQGRIAQQMDDLRKNLKQVSFLQVTATPYALYLQPETYEDGSGKEVFYPKKPAFTALLPIHDAYVGGDDYFGGHAATDPRYYLYVEVQEEEQNALRTADGRSVRRDRLWTSNNITMLRRSLITFLLAVVVRRTQQAEAGQKLQKYAMVMHNDTHRSAHGWQQLVTDNLMAAFEEAAAADDPQLRELVEQAYDDLGLSVVADDGMMPSIEAAYQGVKALILDGELNVQRVNSDTQLEPILDPDTAELRLRTQANLFIGGSILDRGITIKNLIAFYYGRNPNKMQADTVLQHSRMYGARDRRDLAVTRFYTSRRVYDRLSEINDLEAALREAFENGTHENGVVFIQNDPSHGIIPCAPNKVALSGLVALKGNDFLLPTGFDTDSQGRLTKAMRDIDELVPKECIDTNHLTEVPIGLAIAILKAIEPTLCFPEESDFEWEAMDTMLRYYASKTHDHVLIAAATGRRLKRSASGDKSGLSILGATKLRDLVRDPGRRLPALVLLKQDGSPDLEWKAGPFWWPLIASPGNSLPCVFASKVAAKVTKAIWLPASPLSGPGSSR